jgi:hypothetical protein
MATYKPHIPNWVIIVFPLMHALEAIAVYFGFPRLTGWEGLIGSGLYLITAFFFRLTPIPILALPFAVVGVYQLGYYLWIPAIPFFLWPSIYSWFFLKRYDAQTRHLRLRTRKPDAPAKPYIPSMDMTEADTQKPAGTIGRFELES